MKTFLLGMIAGLLLVGSAWAYQKAVVRSRYVDEVIGYNLDVPRFPGVGEKSGISAIFRGQDNGGFASNVNVTIQQGSKTRKEYHDLSLAQMKQLDFKVNEDRDITVSGRDAQRWDYEGTVQGQKLRWLSLAVIEKDRVILVTCTAQAENFDTIAPEFRACLDSFRLRPEVRP